ncbi:hypothetical protein CLU79DRAFT_775237 [Phycomyces nitens]|nr:hypothetical protein CLU79DRAFT_775237 [Phycomyces nitens]
MIHSNRASFPAHQGQYSPKRHSANQVLISQSPKRPRQPISNDDIPLAFLAYKNNRPVSLTLSPVQRPTQPSRPKPTFHSPPLNPSDRPRLTPSGYTYNQRPSRRPVSFAYTQSQSQSPTSSQSTPRPRSQPKRSSTAPSTPLAPSPSPSSSKKRTSLEKAKSWLSSRRQAIKLPF